VKGSDRCNDKQGVATTCVGKVIRGIKIQARGSALECPFGGVAQVMLETRQTAIGSLCLSNFANGSDLVLG
jgi:hypothetical protein